MKAPSLSVVLEAVLTLGLAASGALLLAGLASASAELLRWGIVVLMLTPVARVVVLTVGLFHDRDVLFGVVSLGILAVLMSSIAVAVRI